MATATRTEGLPVGVRGTRPSGWWGMALVVGTEAAFFSYLLFGYFYLGSIAPRWPTAPAPELALSGANTAILLASSAAYWWGERGIRRGDQTRLRVGLLLTAALGLVFLAIQAVEYSRKSFTPRTDAYGSLFFTITGFHGAHVAAGVLMVLVTLARAARGHFSAERHEMVSNAGLYWHFVDVVWLAVFTSLYLTPRFL